MLVSAQDADVTLAIEPFHPMLIDERSAIVTLQQALALAQAFDSPHVQVALDSYHLWWDPTLNEGIGAARNRIATVQIGDWLTPNGNIVEARELPGDGVIDLAGFLGAVHEAGYDGPVEVEVLNPRVWDMPIDLLVREVLARYVRLRSQFPAATH
jgi:sugar phosphate isomerase/epimerase